MVFSRIRRWRRAYLVFVALGALLWCCAIVCPAFASPPAESIAARPAECKHLHQQRHQVRTLAELDLNSARARPRLILSANGRLSSAPVAISENTALTVISPESWAELRVVVTKALRDTHQRLELLLGELPTVSTSVRLMTTENFTAATGAPDWTNALYYRGQVLIPIDTNEPVDLGVVSRAVAHEYTHAVLNTLSNGRLAGWLDEGFAQWIEGEENPILKPALYAWLAENDPLPLRKMQGGFTRFPSEIVPAAYAQSLLSTTIVLNTFGFPGLRSYLDLLAAGASNEDAMVSAFEATPDEFEARLSRTLRHWFEKQQKVVSTARVQRARSTLSEISQALSDTEPTGAQARANW